MTQIKLSPINPGRTISGNSASDAGAIVGYGGGGSSSISNSTISNNHALGVSAISSTGSFSGIDLLNSILSGNLSSSGSVQVELGSGSTTYNNVFGQAGSSSAQTIAGFAPDSTDIFLTDDSANPTPLGSIIAPLADNGGATKTHALVKGSLAIDMGDDSICV